MVTDPQPILRVSVPQEVTKISTTPKLSLLLLLLQEGWKVDEQATLLFKKKSSLRLPPTMLMRASTSLAALARREDIFKKGATQIELDQCDGYYKCLMDLSDLKKFHSQRGFKTFGNDEFLRLLKGLPVHAAGAASAAILDNGVGTDAGMGALEDGRASDDDVVGVVALPPGLEVGDVPMAGVRPPVRCGGHIVHFDGYSHTSGRLRMFISCSNPEHGKCEKYKFVHAFPTEKATAAWLMAWKDMSRLVTDRLEHYSLEPSEAAMDSWIERLA